MKKLVLENFHYGIYIDSTTIEYKNHKEVLTLINELKKEDQYINEMESESGEPCSPWSCSFIYKNKKYSFRQDV